MPLLVCLLLPFAAITPVTQNALGTFGTEYQVENFAIASGVPSGV